MKRWKQYFPLLRCPACRRWLVLNSHAHYALRSASKAEILEVRGDEGASE